MPDHGISRRTVLGAAGVAGLAALVPGPVRAEPAAPPKPDPALDRLIGRDPYRRLRHGSPAEAGLLADQLDTLVTHLAAFGQPSPVHPLFPGAVVLTARDGVIALERAMGDALRYSAFDYATGVATELPPDQRIAMRTDTRFDLASLSKLFTSTVAVQAIERGRLDLTAPVVRYLPAFGANGKDAITIRNLLTHTSGLRPDLPFYNYATRADQENLLYADTPLAPPDTQYVYSDLNMITLQFVLERITGRTLDRLVRDGITRPLGMAATGYNPPAADRNRTAATEYEMKPYAALDRGLVWGEVHDENAYALGGVAGHAGVFSTAADLAVLCQTMLNGGAYGGRRILSRRSVELMFTNFNQKFPGDEHGLGFELYQFWYMGSMATPYSAGHTGFTGTCLVIDPTTQSFFVLLTNAVHPYRGWPHGSAARVSVGTDLGRAVAVRPADGPTAWYGGNTTHATTTLTVPLRLSGGAAEASFALWWDTEPDSDFGYLELSADGGTTWTPVPFTVAGVPAAGAAGSVQGWGGRRWHRARADLSGHAGQVSLRWRYATDPLYVGRGLYVDGLEVRDRGRLVFSDRRPADAATIALDGWTASPN
jgi:CubicO group peptidase (beta-lactamase class C family)